MLMLGALVVCLLCHCSPVFIHGAAVDWEEVTPEIQVYPDSAAAVPSQGVESLVIEGVDVSQLSDESLEEFLSALDEKFYGEIDLLVGKHTLEILHQTRRTKRWIPLVARGLFTVGRSIFRAVSRPKVSRSAGKITRQYNRRGNFRKAVSDFHRMKPTNVRRFSGKNGLVGLEGRLGKNTIKVRSNSSGRRPTMDIYKTDKSARRILRKVRYDRD